MRVQFWGTRGSIATPGPGTVRYGGNTSCVSIHTSGGTHLVLDAGTGLRGLGKALMAQGAAAASRGHLLIGHTHWDHIQGFPFFAPLFESGFVWDVYAPRGFGASLRDTLAGQMQYAYFPVNIDAMGATIQYHELVEGTFTIDDVRVTARYLNHPALTLGYRIEADGITVVYSSDHECHAQSAALGAPLGQILGPLHPGDSRHRDFIVGADLLIHDAQYTAAEYPKHIGWGHSTVEYVVDLAISGGVRRLELFHHDPSRDDDAMDLLVAAARQRVVDAGAAVQVFAATESAVLDLLAVAHALTVPADDAEVEVDTVSLAEKQVLIACADPGLSLRLLAAVDDEGLPAQLAGSQQEALQLADPDRLGVAIVALQAGTDDAVALTRALRATPGMAQLPVILIAPTDACAAPDVCTGAAGAAPSAVTEWLSPRFTKTYLRTKLRAALLRTRARWQAAPMPSDEAQRLEALYRLAILDSPPEERFDRITRLASRLFGVPIALISLVDRDRQWFKSRVGALGPQTSREASFCAHAILEPRAMVIHDALDDDRFADNPLVISEPRLRFYAGHPIMALDGSAVGTLCLVDHQPRHFGEADIRVLADLAALVERELHTER